MDQQLSIHSYLLKLIPPDAKTILEVGFNIGTLARNYKSINPHAHYFGIELNPDAAKQALENLDGVIIEHVEKLNESQLGLSPETVDCIIYNSVLEYLIDPWAVVKRQVRCLQKSGVVIAAIANVQHWQLIVKLLQGKWGRQTDGLIPKGQLRFFTFESIQKLLNESQLQCSNVDLIKDISPEFEKFQREIQPLLNTLNILPHQFTLQSSVSHYIVQGLKSLQAPKKLLVQTMLMDHLVCGRVRIWEPDQFTSMIPGVRTISSVKSADLTIGLPQEEKVFIWQRPIFTYPDSIYQLKQLLQKDYLVILEFDDDPNRWPKIIENDFLTFRGCHAVQTSTVFLAEYLRQFNPNIAIFPNQIARLPVPRIYNEDQPITLFFGAINRANDAQPILPIINAILKEYQEKIRVKVIFDEVFFKSLDTPYKDFEPLCPYDKYVEILKECDLALLPLLDTHFNRCKSDLKFIESAAYGVTVIASNTVYEASIQDGKTGFIYHSPEEFDVKFRELLDNKNKRRELAYNAYEWVKNYRLLSQHFRQRYDWYIRLRAELPRLNQELRERVPELFKE